MDLLPQVGVAQASELRLMIEARRLFSLGIGLIEAHRIASALIDAPKLLWTRDRRLRRVTRKAWHSRHLCYRPGKLSCPSAAKGRTVFGPSGTVEAVPSTVLDLRDRAPRVGVRCLLIGLRALPQLRPAVQTMEAELFATWLHYPPPSLCL